MASPITELETVIIMFSLLVFALFTLTGMLNEECAHWNDLKIAAVVLLQMELPFSSFELTFIIFAFIIVSLFSLASVCIQPHEDVPEKDPCEENKKKNKKQSLITNLAGEEA